MLSRRASTVIAWLKFAHVVVERDDKLLLNPDAVDNIGTLRFEDNTEPILPSTFELKEYETVSQRAAQARGTVKQLVDVAKRDRANDTHIDLVNLVSESLRRRNILPRYNQYIDLAAKFDNKPYIFEMKSFDENRRNVRSQIRKGLSQLYEYRYLQNLPDANLVLVVEYQLPENLRWMQDYLENDRTIFVVWDGDSKLHASPETCKALSFLW